jgi:hypothetical protein
MNVVQVTLLLEFPEEEARVVGRWLARHLKGDFERTLVLLETTTVHRFTIQTARAGMPVDC